MKVSKAARPALLVGAALLSVVVTNACANDVGADEDEPFDDRANELEQGIYDCTESAATGYRSGSSFPITVVHVDAKPVQVDTANAYVAMQAKAKRAGINLRIVSGFRSMAEQQHLYNCYLTGSCNGGNLAARPGYSNHQSGHALDLNTSDAGVYSWLSNHAHEFGFARTVPSEIWHWEWWGDRAELDGPCGVPQIPHECRTGNYDGAYCDDDGKADEQSHDHLHDDLGVNFHCGAMGGNPAFCGHDDASRANSMYVLGAAAHIPLSGHPDAFVDDDGNARERYLNAAKDYGILLGYSGRRVKPSTIATRNTLATMLVRMYKLPAASHDYFYDDDGDASEATHNKVAAAGLITGYADAHHTRRSFKGTSKATRDTLATIAWRAHQRGLVPVWDIPDACLRGAFDGTFCDDDGTSTEASIERLVGDLGVSWHCRDLAGHPAFCPRMEASRADAMYALGAAAGIPLGGDPDGFRDDDGHPREAYLDAAKAWGVLYGYNGGRDVKPDNVATRNTLAVMLVRMYALPAPPPGTPDAFSDDNGTSGEAAHNKVAYAGLFTGYDDGHGGREFRGSGSATRGTLAILAARAADAGLVPVWAQQSIAPSPVPGDDPAAGGDAPGTDSGDPAAAGDDPAPGVGPTDDDLVDDGATGLDGGGLDGGRLGGGALEAPPEGLGAPPRRPAVSAGCTAVTVDVGGAHAALLALLALLRRRRTCR